MAKVPSRLLIVDTDISSAAGGADAVHPRAKNCRDTLLTILRVCHRVLMSRAMLEEWNRHRSAFARQWLVQMMGRKKVELETVSEDVHLRRRIGLTIATESARQAILKDALLIEAAIAADRIVLSLDEVARALFKESAATILELRAIAWANPELDESVIAWLEAGAPSIRDRHLGE